MENFKAINPSNSPYTPSSLIHSPSPLRKANVRNISSGLAREVFTFGSEEPEADPFGRAADSPSTFMKAKFFSLKGESDSSSNEWSSDSSCGGYLDLECESPRKVAQKNPFNSDQIFEEIASDVPCRSSNPIINDKRFNCVEKSLFAPSSRKNFSLRVETKNSEF